MIENFPNWINGMFILCVIYTLIMFHYANGKPIKITLLLVLWCILHSVLAFSGFFHNTEAMPPRFILVLLPPSLMIIYSLRSQPLDLIIKTRSLTISTFLHVVRIPVEIALFYLFLHKMVPELMTFEGRNFDILAGITALLIGLLFLYKKVNKKILIYWNVIGLILVLMILFNGLLSSKLPFQQFGFDQPNVALNYFPFILLPALIVPVVIFTHITDIIKLRRELNN